MPSYSGITSLTNIGLVVLLLILYPIEASCSDYWVGRTNGSRVSG